MLILTVSKLNYFCFSRNYENLKEKIQEISNTNNLKFKDLSYYFLSDANAENIREMDGKTVLIDYDDIWGWVFKNKDTIKALKGVKRKQREERAINVKR